MMLVTIQATDLRMMWSPAISTGVEVSCSFGQVIGKQAATIIEIREKQRPQTKLSAVPVEKIFSNHFSVPRSGAFKVDARDQTADPCMVPPASCEPGFYYANCGLVSDSLFLGL